MKKKLLILIIAVTSLSLIATKHDISQNQNDYNAKYRDTSIDNTRDPWDLLLQFDASSPTGQTNLVGTEWDGEFFYVTELNGSDQLHKFDSEGNYIESITIPVIAARDLAYDGEYMYGSAAGSTVYCWDSQTGEAVPENNIEIEGIHVTAIAYDPDTDTFWSGNRENPIFNWDRDGNIINTFTNPEDLNIWGLAFDHEDPNGPFLYGFHRNPGCTIIKMDIGDLSILESVNVTAHGGDNAYAGGLCCMSDWESGFCTLGGFLRGTPGYICVYELCEIVLSESPAEPAMFTVTPDAGGALSAELGWMNPDETVVGDPLTDLDEMRVYRDDELIHTINNPTIGGIENWTDSVPESGMYSYSVVGFNDEGEGDHARESAWIGEDSPGQVVGLTLINMNTIAEVSWSNPTEGLHGGPFNEIIEGYHIVRNDGEEFEPTGVLTSWSDDSITEGGFYAYTITAYNAIGDGVPVVSDSVWIGENQPVMHGDPNSTEISGFPVSYFYRSSLTQTIYYAEDFHSQGVDYGVITSIMYYYDFSESILNSPINIWMMNTDLENLENGFVSAEEMTMVFSSCVSFPSENQEVSIALDQLFLYEGQNLIISAERVFATNNNNQTHAFMSTETGNPYNTVYDHSLFVDLDPYYPPGSPLFSSEIPNTMIFINQFDIGSMEGYVFNQNTSIPLADVMISVHEQFLTTYTDDNGYYIFPAINEGNYEINASLFGYTEAVETFEIIENETTQHDFYLENIPQVEVTGRVVEAINPEISIANAEVTLSGKGNHEAITDANGYFSINTVYVSNSYEIVIEAESYYILVYDVYIETDNINLGNISLNEIPVKAYDVTAIQNDETAEMEISWHSPCSSPGILWDFEENDGDFIWEGTHFSRWEWGENSNIGAYSGNNVWGTELTGFYYDFFFQLITPEIAIQSEDAVLTFWHYYGTLDGYDGGNVKISTDSGNTWTLLYPIGGYPNSHCEGLAGEPCYSGHSDEWIPAAFEIGMYYREQVLINFQFGTSSEGDDYPGWYIDDVYIGKNRYSQTNRNIQPVFTSPTYNDNQRSVDYNIYRLFEGEEEQEESWITLAESITDTTYTDTLWSTLESDLYKYTIKAVYSDNILSDPAFSNWIAKDYYTTATVSVFDYFDNLLEVAEVKFMGLNPDPDGLLHNYEVFTNPDGEAFFSQIWKGTYNIRVTKEEMATYYETLVSIYEPYSLEVHMTEVINPINGLDYSVIDNDVTLSWNNPADERSSNKPAIIKKYISKNSNGAFIDQPLYEFTHERSRETRIFEHFKIYRDGDIIADDVTELTYTDEDLLDGTYTYGITAFYTCGESEIVEAEIEVYPLNVTGFVTAFDTPETTAFEGVEITIGNGMFLWETITDTNGEFMFTGINGNQTYTISCNYENYQTWSEELIVTDMDVDFDNITLFEKIWPAYMVQAEKNTEDTECTIKWHSPGVWPEYEIIYDDNESENATAWYEEGSRRAVWFTAQGGPCQVVGGSMNIYDGTWPAGQILTPFTAAVWAYDEATGLPGEMLTSTIVTPTDYFWVDFTFDEPVMIEGADFFLGYIQGGDYPNCAPISVDETEPLVNRSYDNCVVGHDGWGVSDHQDFMLRAKVASPHGYNMTLSYDNPVGTFGKDGMNKLINVMENAPETDLIHQYRDFTGYVIIRGEFDDEENWFMWDIVETNLQDTIYTDNNWVDLEEQRVYKYGVLSAYSNNVMSTPSFSNWVAKGINIPVNIYVTGYCGEPLNGAMVTLTCDDSIHTYQENTSEGGVQWQNIWEGTYNLSISKTGYHQYNQTDICIADSTEMHVQLNEVILPPSNLEVNTFTGIITWNEPEIVATIPQTHLIFNDKTHERSAHINNSGGEMSYISSRYFDHYNIYHQGELIGQTEETSYDLSSFLTNGVEYTAGVSSQYHSGEESDWVEITFVYGLIEEIPEITELLGNYPNPFNPQTDITYAVKEPGIVNIEIFNIRGQKIKTLIDEYKDAGKYKAAWDGTKDSGMQATSGVYFYKMKSGQYTSSKKMILMK